MEVKAVENRLIAGSSELVQAFGSSAEHRSRLADFRALTKPRVMGLAVFTALVGLIRAPQQLESLNAVIVAIAIATGAGAAGALNMCFDADIDAVMRRTAMRPIPRGRISRSEGLSFGLVLGVVAVALLALAANLIAAALLAGTIFFYAVVYTLWLKRRTPQNIVIGGAAGAMPPVIGWAAATGQIGLEPLVLSLMIFLWTPAHFWALAINRTDEYARANVPMLPVVAGPLKTAQQILIYSVLLVVASALPVVLGFAGAPYGIVAAVCGAIFLRSAFTLYGKAGTDPRTASSLFVFSIVYLFALFAALLIEV